MLNPAAARSIAALCALALLLGCATTSPPAAEAPDIANLHPGDLLGPNLRGLHQQARVAYEAGRYEDAARLYASLVRARPTDGVALYNLACCYGLLGAEAQAAEFVAAAWGSGFRDLDLIRSDSDFDRVRDSDAWRSLMTVLERALAPAFEMEAPTATTVHVGRAGDLSEDRLYPLVIGLHGYNASPGPFANLFADLELEAPFVYCAPRAPQAVAGGPGFSWFSPAPDGGPSRLQDRLNVEYVLAVVEAMAERYPVDRDQVYVLGFSQGAGMAYEVALSRPQALAGAIPIGGRLDMEGPDSDRLAAVENLAVLICHSPEDGAVAFREAENAAEALDRAGARAEFLSYRGGHVVSQELAASIAAWIADQAGSAELR